MLQRPLPFYALIALCSLAAAPATQPEIRHGLPMAGTPPERAKRYFERLAALAEPTGHADPARLASYLAVLKRDLVHDPRLVAFSPYADLRNDDTVVLGGFAEYPELKDTAVKFLQAVGFPHVEDRMELLPSTDLEGKPFAIVTATKAFLYDKPQQPHESLTQALKGDGLFLLKKEGDFYLCHSSDGYLGYVAAADLRRADTDAMKQALTASPGSGPREKIEAIIATGQQFLGTPYVWGGRTKDGIDCSGLTGISFQAQGITLPRDADEQALCGTLVATRSFRAALRRGDLLFFISNRGTIHHVALYLGDDQFLEAATPVAKISSLNPKDKNYAEKRDKSFGFAKRVLN